MLARLGWHHLDDRDRQVVGVFLVTLGLNAAVAAAKIAVGVASGRLAVLGDGFHSVLDAGNNVFGVAALVVAAQPPDREHPYGHRKFENLAAMAIGGLIVLVAWELLDNILRTLWGAWSQPGRVRTFDPPDPLFLVLLAASIGVNLGVAAWQRRRGRALDSTLLLADAGHTRADAAVTALGIGSLLLAPLGWWIDPLLAAVVLWFLGHAAWQIIQENLPAITDRALLDPREVRRVVLGVAGVHATSAIRSHGPRHDIHLDLAITIDPGVSAADAEQLEDAVRDALGARFPGLTLIAIEHRTEAAAAAAAGAAAGPAPARAR